MSCPGEYVRAPCPPAAPQPAMLVNCGGLRRTGRPAACSLSCRPKAGAVDRGLRPRWFDRARRGPRSAGRRVGVCVRGETSPACNAMQGRSEALWCWERAERCAEGSDTALASLRRCGATRLGKPERCREARKALGRTRTSDGLGFGLASSSLVKLRVPAINGPRNVGSRPRHHR